MGYQMKIAKIIVFLFVAILGSLIISEILLHIISYAFPKQSYQIWPKPVVEDRELMYRPNPGHPEHDKNGFRNKCVPAAADIVALGDSQTYGVTVKREYAWPHQLALFTDFTVYNMAYGGYGPVHSLILFDEAAAFNPKLIIYAFYSGNDLCDSYRLVYGLSQQMELKSKDERTLRAIQALENKAPLIQKPARSTRLFHEAPKLYIVLSRLKNKVIGFFKPIKKRASKHTRWDEVKAAALENPKRIEIYESNDVRTAFTPAYRLTGVNFEDVRILEGFNISMRAIEKMALLSKINGNEFMVLLIPTKELVFKDLVNLKIMSAEYNKLLEHEETLWINTKNYLTGLNVKFIDILPVFRKLVSNAVHPYEATRTGHPNELGHYAIARQISDYLRAAKNKK